jgi:hypothetical protein
VPWEYQRPYQSNELIALSIQLGSQRILPIANESTLQAVKSVFLQKSNGKYYLVLWRGLPAWNETTKTDIGNGAIGVRVKLSSTAAAISQISPTAGTTPTTLVTVSNSNNFIIQVPDSPEIIEITP